MNKQFFSNLNLKNEVVRMLRVTHQFDQLMHLHSNKYAPQLLLTILALSFIINGFFLWELNFSEKPSLPSQTDSLAKLKNELQLTDIQRKEFDAIQSEFLKTASDIEATIKTHQKQLNETIFAAHPDESTVADLTRYIADKHYHLQWIRYRQWVKLKKICTTEQRQKLKQLLTSY